MVCVLKANFFSLLRSLLSFGSSGTFRNRGRYASSVSKEHLAYQEQFRVMEIDSLCHNSQVRPPCSGSLTAFS
jgi:hypothetical protein